MVISFGFYLSCHTTSTGFQERARSFKYYREFSRVSDGRLQGFIVSRVQKDNVANQREHLTLILANVHIRLLPRPEPMHKV